MVRSDNQSRQAAEIRHIKGGKNRSEVVAEDHSAQGTICTLFKYIRYIAPEIKINMHVVVPAGSDTT